MGEIKYNLIGQSFGRLTVIEFMGRKNLHSWFKCRCECGGETTTTSNNLRRGNSQSCGCLQKERASVSSKTHGESSKKTSEYRAWKGMKQRCYNSNDKRFPDWGGRGIIVCDRWRKSFENFIKDMGRKPTPYHSLDRYPDNNGNYEPLNCRWGTDEQQRRGKRNNVYFEFNGKKMVVADWAKYFKVNNSTLQEHIKRGKRFEDIYAFYEQKNKLK